MPPREPLIVVPGTPLPELMADTSTGVIPDSGLCGHGGRVAAPGGPHIVDAARWSCSPVPGPLSDVAQILDVARGCLTAVNIDVSDRLGVALIPTRPRGLAVPGTVPAGEAVAPDGIHWYGVPVVHNGSN